MLIGKPYDSDDIRQLLDTVRAMRPGQSVDVREPTVSARALAKRVRKILTERLPGTYIIISVIDAEAVRVRIGRLGERKTRIAWTDEDIALLAAQRCPDVEAIAERLGISPHSVRGKRAHLRRAALALARGEVQP